MPASVRLDGHDLRSLQARRSSPSRAGRRAGSGALSHVDRGQRPLRPARRDRRRPGGARSRPPAIAGFVAGLPDGLQTIVGDRGLALSAGERQRIALARAFLDQSVRAGARRAQRGAGPGRRTAYRRGLSPRHARPDDDSHLASARARPRRRPRRRARRRADRRARDAGRARGARRRVRGALRHSWHATHDKPGAAAPPAGVGWPR